MTPSHTHEHHTSMHGSQNHNKNTSFTPPKTPWTDWIPLIVVISYIIGLTVLSSILTSFTVNNLLNYSMGYFFIVFSMFKMIDLRGFAMGYHKYDIISQRWYTWGYIAPFIELILGLLYVKHLDNPMLHVATLIFSILIVIGVSKKLAKREIFTCACLGTVLKVPLTKVSLIEYLVMAIMAASMLAVKM